MSDLSGMLIPAINVITVDLELEPIALTVYKAVCRTITREILGHFWLAVRAFRRVVRHPKLLGDFVFDRRGAMP